MSPRPDDTETGTKIGDTSLVSVALFRWIVGGIIGAAGTVLGAAMWASSVNAKLEATVLAGTQSAQAQSKQGQDISAIRDSMSGLSLIVHDMQRDLKDQWRLSDTVWWTSEFQRLNPEIKMPALGTMPSLMRAGGDRTDDH